METLSHKKMNLIDTFANSLILSLVLQKMYGDKKYEFEFWYQGLKA